MFNALLKKAIKITKRYASIELTGIELTRMKLCQ